MEAAISKCGVQWQGGEIFKRVVDVLVAVLKVDACAIHCERSLRIDLGARSTNFLTIGYAIQKAFSVPAYTELFFHSAVNRMTKDHGIYVDRVGVLTAIGAEALMGHAPWMQGKWHKDIVHEGVPIDSLMTVGYIVHYLEWKLGITS